MTTKTIELSQGYVALVDDKNYARLMEGPKWYAHGKRNDEGSIKNVYARRIIVVNGKRATQMMHRFIMGITDSKIKVDHFDHNGLSNLESNLRAATSADNNHNRRLSRANSSGYKGVSWNNQRNKWHAHIQVDNHDIFLGQFTDILDAREAYDAAALRYHGEFAYTNAMMEAEKGGTIDVK